MSTGLPWRNRARILLKAERLLIAFYQVPRPLSGAKGPALGNYRPQPIKPVRRRTSSDADVSHQMAPGHNASLLCLASDAWPVAWRTPATSARTSSGGCSSTSATRGGAVGGGTQTGGRARADPQMRRCDPRRDDRGGLNGQWRIVTCRPVSAVVTGQESSAGSSALRGRMINSGKPLRCSDFGPDDFAGSFWWEVPAPSDAQGVDESEAAATFGAGLGFHEHG